MIIDTSALVSIIRGEPDGSLFASRLSTADSARISAATLVELSIVIDRDSSPTSSGLLDQLVERSGIEVVPFTDDQAKIARRAYREFGKGSGHRAGLNLGDCFAYALAKETGEPLLFKGDDFTHTDVTPALA